MDVFGWILVGIGAVIILGLLLVGDALSTLVILLLAAILIFVLVNFGFVNITAEPNQLDILFNPSPAPPFATPEGQHTNIAPAPQVSGPEVFYVSDNKFTYEEAPYVCKAYDAELASYIQVEQAYNMGAEWCGYGWSAGGIALFPTQQASWEARMSDPDPKKREMCGRPGVNGGYFDPAMKFGVNCFGIKPVQPPQPKVSLENDRMVGMFKDQIDKLVVTPFTKNTWSEYNIQNTHTDTHGAAPTPSSNVPVAPAPAPAPSTAPVTRSAVAPPPSTSTAPTGGSTTTGSGAPVVAVTVSGSIVPTINPTFDGTVSNAFSTLIGNVNDLVTQTTSLISA